MRLLSIHILFTILLVGTTYAQDMSEYNGGWEGTIADPNAFNLKVTIEGLHAENSVIRIANSRTIITHTFQSTSGNTIEITLSENLLFEGILSASGEEINGFIKSGLLLYHLKLTRGQSNAFVGSWNVLMVDTLLSQSLYLSVEQGSEDSFQAYPIFGDDRFTGTWCANFHKAHDTIAFTDYKTGLNFQGQLLPDEILLGVFLGEYPITEISLKKSVASWQIGVDNASDNPNGISDLQLQAMETLIANDSLPNTHAVLVSKKGKLIYENYFKAYNHAIPHDMRSASKSISSTIAGIAKDKALFEDVHQTLFEFLPEALQIYKDSLKAKIDLQSLLTMSSGLDAIDFGIDRASAASEDNYQSSEDWIETILAASMVNQPNSQANYGSANPYLLGVAMDSIVAGSLALFMDEHLFQPLAISNYIIQTDMNGLPYFGGGMYMTHRDMLKYGQLYLNNGEWNGTQVLSESWINKSLTNQMVLENTHDKNGYGYLWWHNQYNHHGKSIKSIEARGAGGQYIFLIPKAEVVVVITSGNYRNGKTQQPESILQNYILPFMEL